MNDLHRVRARRACLASLSMLSFVTAGVSMAREADNPTPAASATPAGKAQEAGSEKARIRLFGQNGTTVDFFQNSTCVGGSAARTRVSGGVGDAFSSFLGSVKNTSIGIKETPTTQELSQRDGIVSKAYFREYEVAAGQPLTVSMFFQSVPTGSRFTCRNLGGTFTPEAGKDYEIALKFRSDQCLASIQEIRQDEQGQVALLDVEARSTTKCE